tara:strand:+ start:82 stop:243 length:162 start_codon:yes stop_codon:yes gene_type:complete
MKTETIYKKEEDGTLTLIETREIDAPSQEEIIAEKEEQLLAMYTEIQKLKQQL